MKKVKILNLTQHPATPDQLEAGVFEPKNKERIREALTFNELPSYRQIKARAILLTAYALEEIDRYCEENVEVDDEGNLVSVEGKSCCDLEFKVLIGGAPYLMAPLEAELKRQLLTPVYSFTKRETIERQNPDGTVTKTQTFKHQGWIEVE